MKDKSQRIAASSIITPSKEIYRRPDWDEYFLKIAEDVSLRGTCARRRVGCVLTDFRHNILSTGYNGNARGLPHCYLHPCSGANFKSGTGLDQCDAIHAEQNAIATCRNVFEIETCYTTVSPCNSCVKLLMGTSCERLVFLEEYPQPEAKELWERKVGNVWALVKKTW